MSTAQILLALADLSMELQALGLSFDDATDLVADAWEA